MEKKPTVKVIKGRQDWRKQGPCCKNCRNFSFVESTEEIYGYSRKVIKNKHCLIGGFATGMNSWCKHHEWRENE